MEEYPPLSVGAGRWRHDTSSDWEQDPGPPLRLSASSEDCNK